MHIKKIVLYIFDSMCINLYLSDYYYIFKYLQININDTNDIGTYYVLLLSHLKGLF